MSIKLQNIAVTYPNGHTPFYDLSLTLDRGQIYGLIGANGCGKSTLFKVMMGLIKPKKGEVLIDNGSIRSALKEHKLAYVPQSEEIDWDFPINVEEVVMLGRYGAMGWRRRASQADRKIVEEALERVDLLPFRKRQIGMLSGGQKKRVFIARALAQRSKILLLDEPFTGVDHTTEHAIIALLRGLKEEGYLILLSTHNLGSIPLFCDEAILLYRSQIFAKGAVDQIYTQENLEAIFGCDLRTLILHQSAHQCAPESAHSEHQLYSAATSLCDDACDNIEERKDD